MTSDSDSNSGVRPGAVGLSNGRHLAASETRGWPVAWTVRRTCGSLCGYLWLTASAWECARSIRRRESPGAGLGSVPSATTSERSSRCSFSGADGKSRSFGIEHDPIQALADWGFFALDRVGHSEDARIVRDVAADLVSGSHSPEPALHVSRYVPPDFQTSRGRRRESARDPATLPVELRSHR